MQETQRREEAECTVVSKPSVSVSKAASRAAERRGQRDERARDVVAITERWRAR